MRQSEPEAGEYRPALEPRLERYTSAAAVNDRLNELKRIALELRAAARQAGINPMGQTRHTLELALEDIATYQHQAQREVTQDADLMDYGICLNLRQVSAGLRRYAANQSPANGGSLMPDEYRGFSLFVQNLTEAQYRHISNRYEAAQAGAVGVHSVAYLSDYEDYYRAGLVEDIITMLPSDGAMPPGDAEDDPARRITRSARGQKAIMRAVNKVHNRVNLVIHHEENENCITITITNPHCHRANR